MSLRNDCYKQLSDLVKLFSLLSADGVKGLLLFTYPEEEVQENFFLEKGKIFVYLTIKLHLFIAVQLYCALPCTKKSLYC